MNTKHRINFEPPLRVWKTTGEYVTVERNGKTVSIPLWASREWRPNELADYRKEVLGQS